MRRLAGHSDGIIRVCTAVQHRLSLAGAAAGRVPAQASARRRSTSPPTRPSRPVDALLDGRVDLAILIDPRADRRLRLRPLFADEMVADRRQDAPARADARGSAPQDLAAGAPAALLEPAGGELPAAARPRPAGPRRPARVSFIMLTEAMIELARAGTGVGILPRWSAQRAIASGAVVAAVDHPARRCGGTGWRRRSRRSPIRPYLVDFIDLLAERALPARAACASPHERGFIDNRKTFRWSDRADGVACRHGHPRRSPLRLARAARARRRSPPPSPLILGVAIGANSAVFALVNAVLLSPLPFPEPSRLVTVDADARRLDDRAAVDSRLPRSARRQSLVRESRRDVPVEREPDRRRSRTRAGDEGLGRRSSRCSARRAALGRTLRPADEQGSGARVVVLTNRFWMRRFGGSPSAVGVGDDPQRRRLRHRRRPAGGVHHAGPRRRAHRAVSDRHGSAPHRARLRLPARARTAASGRHDRSGARGSRRHHGAAARRVSRNQRDAPRAPSSPTGASALAATQRPVLLLLQGAVALVLLVACANVGNLFLAVGDPARARVRRPRRAGRLRARGASRQVFVETAVDCRWRPAPAVWSLQTLAHARADGPRPGRTCWRSAPPSASNPRVLLFTLRPRLVGDRCCSALMPALRLGGRAARCAAAVARRRPLARLRARSSPPKSRIAVDADHDRRRALAELRQAAGGRSRIPQPIVC